MPGACAREGHDTGAAYLRRLLVVLAAVTLQSGCLCWLTGNCEDPFTAPRAPFPIDGGGDLSTSLTLSWQGGDDPGGRTVLYNVYFGDVSPPQLYRTGLKEKAIAFDSLAGGVMYYWRIVAYRQDGISISGPVWKFRTAFPPAFVQITSPTLLTNWIVGETRTITWFSARAGSAFRVDLYKGPSYLCIIAATTPSGGTQQWAVQDCGGGTEANYRIRVTSVLDDSLYAFSQYFTISDPCPITIVSPRSGVLWTTGEMQTIRWKTQGGTIRKIALELYKGSSFHYMLVASTWNDGSFAWTPNDYEGGTSWDYRLKVTDLTFGDGCSSFSSYFTIKVCDIDVSSPASGDVWPLGETRNIVWNTSGQGPLVKIELLRKSNVVCVIAPSTANDGVYPWAVTHCGTYERDAYQIRITDFLTGNCGMGGPFSLR